MSEEESKTQDVSRDVVPAGVEELEVIDTRSGAFGAHDTGDTSGFGGLVRPIVMPGAAQKPYGGWFDQVADDLERLAPPDAIEKIVIDRGEITFFIRRASILEVVTQLRNAESLRFEFCSSISGVHYPHETGRELHVAYHLTSMTHGRRIRLEVTAPDDDPHVPSVVSIYPTADWHERETWDMFGIQFDGHPALTRILMPDDWPGHPQRKDYPLGGIPVEYKGGTVPPPDQRRNYS